MTYGEKAKDNFLNGYTCAQAVLAAFQDEKWFKESGLSVETAMKLASSFGGGMGRLREVCGTVSGMFMAFGIAHGFSAPPESQDAKTEHYKCIQELAAIFKAENGSIVCRELLAGTD
ncbi:MAG: C-GCAxxG-C-C family protein, partial [Treponemataceae bacterium]|nr:C-GCAxxG-C-C family protein [Treponemataceae bacterium]